MSEIFVVRTLRGSYLALGYLRQRLGYGRAAKAAPVSAKGLARHDYLTKKWTQGPVHKCILLGVNKRLKKHWASGSF